MARRHTVRAGECIESIAHQYGLWWKTVWDHPANAALRQQRKSHNVLFPGDIVVVPDRRDRSEARETDQTHRFRRRGVPARLRVQFVEDGEPLADLPYRYEVADTFVRAGRTDADGGVNEWIFPEAQTARLVLAPGTKEERVIPLRVGHMDPITTESGVRGRLFNLGYLERIDDDLDELALALCFFQADEGLPVSATCDEATADKLVRRHGG